MSAADSLSAYRRRSLRPWGQQPERASGESEAEFGASGRSRLTARELLTRSLRILVSPWQIWRNRAEEVARPGASPHGENVRSCLPVGGSPPMWPITNSLVRDSVQVDPKCEVSRTALQQLGPTSTSGSEEVYFHRRPACRSPRYEPRARWPRRAPCAGPHALIRGRPGVRVDLDVRYISDRKHLPVVAIRNAA